MKVAERAAQIWPLLSWAAANRQLLSYELLAKLIGVPRVGLGQVLEPIQCYCLVHELPPLTILVVSSETGMPGEGFIAAADIPRFQASVFATNWLDIKTPSPEEFAAAVASRGST